MSGLESELATLRSRLDAVKGSGQGLEEQVKEAKKTLRDRKAKALNSCE